MTEIRTDYALDSSVCDGLAFRICHRRGDDCVGMHVHRVGNAQPVRMGFPHCRGRTHCDRSLGYAERCDSPRVAQIFSRAHECVGLAVTSTPNFCQVRVMKRPKDASFWRYHDPR